jgi:hypothetical protein
MSRNYLSASALEPMALINNGQNPIRGRPLDFNGISVSVSSQKFFGRDITYRGRNA